MSDARAPTGLDLLSEREREVLRLITRGHDAKSAASELGLSVHTINERLRAARRKLDVTSSREAARRLFSCEVGTNENSVSNQLGDAELPLSPDTEDTASQTRRVVWIGGLVVMMISALALVVAPLYFEEQGAPGADYARPIGSPASAIEEEQIKEWERAALAWLTLVDESNWEASFAAAGASFQELNTVAGWRDASLQARVPLGTVTKRRTHTAGYVNAPPHGYVIMEFHSDFAARIGAIEKVTLEKEDGRWNVVGYVIE